MKGVLDELLATAHRRARALPETAAPRADGPSFAAALRGRDRVAVVAEFKRRSPSVPALAPEAGLEERVTAYRDAGAAALSVLTEPSRFAGRDDDLTAAVAATGLPVLMKDFVVDPRQVAQAARLGAAAVLLIARCLEDERLHLLAARASDLGLDVLIECHDAAEVERALAVPGALVGINNRDLDRLDVDRGRADALLSMVPADRIAVAESGYETPGQVRALRGRCDAVLIGTALMRGGDPAAFLREVHP